MLRARACLATVLITLAACGANIKTKEKVNEAVLERLRKSSGLDMNSIEVSTTAVSFDRNLAYATVAFRQKGESSLTSGMVMTYTLEQRGNKWVVTKVGGSHAAPSIGGSGNSSGSTAGTLPPGHPPLSSDQSAPTPGQGDGVRPQ